MLKYDVIVIGAGHAGVEASLAASRMGRRTLLITTNLDRIAYMSCNPSIGGLGKGHMVREIDVLGGQMGLAADQTCIQFKRLNSRKGPAVRGSRSQCDKDLYSQFMHDRVIEQRNLDLRAGEVTRLIIVGDTCQGIVTNCDEKIFARSVVVTTGTFLRGVMHIGLRQIPGGRVGDEATEGISEQLAEFGFKVGRLKTGTPARLRRDSIDWSKTEPQHGDQRFVPFSVRSSRDLKLPQVPCYLSYTNERTHDIIRRNLDKSPMYCGVIQGLGPRYCPSIEDKITRFADKERHQTFLEPEGLSTDSIYLQGISTSLPEEVQLEFLRTIPGLERVEMIRPGYAVEYDFVEPCDLSHSLETRKLKGLFLAGQINGTSGYEEAAGQGLIAGINAALKASDSGEFLLGRDEAYIGVLVDDLITKGTREPYRMMTSRAEHRLVLREDNTLNRLAAKAIAFGLVDEETAEKYNSILSRRLRIIKDLEERWLYPNGETQAKLGLLNTAVLQKPCRLDELLKRPEIRYSDLTHFEIGLGEDELDVLEPVEIEIKYSGYIKRQLSLIEQTQKLESLVLPAEMDYWRVKGLSREEIEKLSGARPRTLGQAQRISGVNPSAIQAVLIHLKGLDRISVKDLDGSRRG